jgi:hypothetical protein
VSIFTEGIHLIRSTIALNLLLLLKRWSRGARGCIIECPELTVITKVMVSLHLYSGCERFYKVGAIRFPPHDSCGRFHLRAGHNFFVMGGDTMARALEEIARLDRRWFRAHPERRHRCRWPDTVELDLCDGGRGAGLVMTIRHLGRGHIVYQPVIFQGGLLRDERSAAALFALAATSPEPIPVVAHMNVLRLRRGLHGLPRRTLAHRGSVSAIEA